MFYTLFQLLVFVVAFKLETLLGGHGLLAAAVAVRAPNRLARTSQTGKVAKRMKNAPTEATESTLRDAQKSGAYKVNKLVADYAEDYLEAQAESRRAESVFRTQKDKDTATVALGKDFDHYVTEFTEYKEDGDVKWEPTSADYARQLDPTVPYEFGKACDHDNKVEGRTCCANCAAKGYRYSLTWSFVRNRLTRRDALAKGKDARTNVVGANTWRNWFVWTLQRLNVPYGDIRTAVDKIMGKTDALPKVDGPTPKGQKFNRYQKLQNELNDMELPGLKAKSTVEAGRQYTALWFEQSQSKKAKTERIEAAGKAGKAAQAVTDAKDKAKKAQIKADNKRNGKK